MKNEFIESSNKRYQMPEMPAKKDDEKRNGLNRNMETKNVWPTCSNIIKQQIFKLM